MATATVSFQGAEKPGRKVSVMYHHGTAKFAATGLVERDDAEGLLLQCGKNANHPLVIARAQVISVSEWVR